MCERVEHRDVRPRRELQVHVSLDVRRTNQRGDARIDDDQLRALAQAALELRAEDGVRIGRIGSDHHDAVRLHHRRKGLCAGRLPERVLQAIACRRVTHPRAGVHVVGSEGGADQLLNQERLLVGAARGSNSAHRVGTVLRLNSPDLARGVTDRFLPGHFAPLIRDLRADHGFRDAIGMRRIAECEAPFDARMALVCMAVAVRGHADHFRLRALALHLGGEAAADSAVRARRRHCALGLPQADDRLLSQRRGWARLDAGTAGDALGLEERLVLAGGNLRLEAAALNGQRERSLHLIAGTHATRADDAQLRIEREVGIALVLGSGTVHLDVVALEAVGSLGDADDLGHVLQLAMPVGRTGHALQRMIGNVQIQHPAPQLRQLLRLRADFHPRSHGGRAGRRETPPPLDLHQAQPAGAEGLQRIGGAQLGHFDPGHGRGPHDRGALGNRHWLAVDLDSNTCGARLGCRCAQVLMIDRKHLGSPQRAGGDARRQLSCAYAPGNRRGSA